MRTAAGGGTMVAMTCALLASGVVACAPAPASVSMPPAAPPPAEPIAVAPDDPTPGWTEADERVILDKLRAECLDGDWASLFAQQRARQPVVRVSRVVNKTERPVLTEALFGALERALLASRRVVVAAGLTDLAAVRAEQDMLLSGSSEDGPRIGEERPADFVVSLTLSESREQSATDVVQRFVASLRLVDAETAEVVCVARAEARRVVAE